MKYEITPPSAPKGLSFDPENTLRVLANLPPPSGLNDRVHRNLQGRQNEAQPKRVWFNSQPAMRLQFVAGAILLVALAGGSWNLYRTSHRAITAPPHIASPGSFGGAGAVTVPKTLAPIHVLAAPRKKLGVVGHGVKSKPEGQSTAAPKSQLSPDQ